MMKKKTNWQTVLTVCILLLLTVNVLVTTKLSWNIQKLQRRSGQSESLPCKVIPVRFAIEEPYCADKLLKSMNITNIHVIPAEDIDLGWDDRVFRQQNQSGENK